MPIPYISAIIVFTIPLILSQIIINEGQYSSNFTKTDKTRLKLTFVVAELLTVAASIKVLYACNECPCSPLLINAVYQLCLIASLISVFSYDNLNLGKFNLFVSFGVLLVMIMRFAKKKTIFGMFLLPNIVLLFLLRSLFNDAHLLSDGQQKENPMSCNTVCGLDH